MINLVLMIDDDPDEKEILYEAVRSYNGNIDFMHAKDGIEALELLDAAVAYPEVIFLDNNMPRMNGTECLRRLKSNDKTSTIPIIMYTTYARNANDKAHLFPDAEFFLPKSNHFGDLCSGINEVLDLIELQWCQNVARR